MFNVIYSGLIWCIELNDDSVILNVDILFFFFFQAEDGIRDRTVTGVQTCALPILSKRSSKCVPATALLEGNIRSKARLECCNFRSLPSERTPVGKLKSRVSTARRRRSEERRVGKEWRSGGGWDA